MVGLATFAYQFWLNLMTSNESRKLIGSYPN